MSIWKVIKSLKYKQLKSAFFLFLKKPLFIYPTLKATIISYKISQREFPKTHHLNGKANAFRHALWNMIICNECNKWTTDIKNAVLWAKTITDWHEELSPNKPLDKAMDLHNNKVGRKLFLDIKELFDKVDTKMSISFLKKKVQSSVKIATVYEMDTKKGELVYLRELSE